MKNLGSNGVLGDTISPKFVYQHFRINLQKKLIKRHGINVDGRNQLPSFY